MTGWSSVSAFDTRIRGPHVPLGGGGGIERTVGPREVQAVPGVDDAPAELAVGEAREVDARADGIAAADPRHLSELAERFDDRIRDRLGRAERVDPPLVGRRPPRPPLGRAGAA